MGLWLASLCSICLAAADGDSAPRTFPYTAYVTADDVYVRSGPGENYYPTGKLKAGDAVEVYRHDPGGWYAIRPPEGSFTWVSGRYLELGEDNLATVTGEGVAARVGSTLSDARDVIQVRLHKGEVVEVLGSKRFGDSHSALWYKISPPAGEFRWICGRYVDPDYPAGAVRKTTAAANPNLPPGVAERAARAVVEPATVDAPAGERAERAVAGPVRAAGHAEPTAAAVVGSLPGAQMASPTNSPRKFTPRPGFEPAGRVESEQSAAAAPVPAWLTGQLSADEFEAELEDIKLRLATMLTREPRQWELAPLMRRAERLLKQAETALQRGQARLLLRRITQAEQIRREEVAWKAAQAAVEARHRQLETLRGEPGQPIGQANLPAEKRFDGVGRLARVVSPKVGAPRYALVDENGDIRCFVTPAPGVNMRSYLGKLIGVTGTRGFIAEHRAAHVMAKHITPLETARR